MTYEPIDHTEPLNGHESITAHESAINAAVNTEIAIPGWWSVLERHSRLLVAAVDLRSHRIEWTSDRFRRLVGMSDTPPSLGESVLQRLSDEDQLLLRERIRRHVLNAIATQHYGREGLFPSRWLHESLILSVKPLGENRPRFVEFTVSSDHIDLVFLDPAVKLALDACWQEMPDAKTILKHLNSSNSPLQKALELLNPQTYQASGTILLEGTDVSDREVTQRLIHLLLDRESILLPHRFQQANELLKRLFRATDTLILTAERETAALYIDLDNADWTTRTLSVQSLQSSAFFQSAMEGNVVNLSNLNDDFPPILCEELCHKRGAKSLLVLPLVVTPVHLQSSAHLLGLIGIVSDKYDAFGTIDEHYGKTLAPALAIAMRQTVNERFTHIHESVRWRFEEESERRSLGLPPAPIIFRDVYPLYGISDIRGSSQERNHAIQKDLLAQFQLGIDIGEAICQALNTAFACQLRDDLQEKIEQLQQGVTVDAEITLLRYLQHNLESHFDFFRTCGDEVVAAIAAYEAAKDPEHGCVYAARSVYDQSIQHINLTLKAVWQRWQRTMQAVSPHYCDVESTDGIDHMIYAGGAIDPTFSPFHLRSLRFEQLRAVCDCARTGFRLKAEHQTDMEITHLVLVQDSTVDITHDESTERLFEVRGTRDTRYEIVKKRIDKALDARTQDRITQPGCLTLVYSTLEEWQEYQEYLRYLRREGLVGEGIEQGSVEPLQGVTGLKFARVRVLE